VATQDPGSEHDIAQKPDLAGTTCGCDHTPLYEVAAIKPRITPRVIARNLLKSDIDPHSRMAGQ
jgi:hypothetical protein